jgi:hypothetical protein
VLLGDGLGEAGESFDEILGRLAGEEDDDRGRADEREQPQGELPMSSLRRSTATARITTASTAPMMGK